MPLITALGFLGLLGLGACTASRDGDHETTPPPVDDSDAPDDSSPDDTVDQDGDGWTPARRDCDDTDPSVHPRAEELPDGLDQDCDGRTDEGTIAYDDDRDGLSEQEGDCDDTDPHISPLATDYYLCDGIDQDCNGSDEPCDSLDDFSLRVVGFSGDRMAQAVGGGMDMTGDGQPDLLAYDGDLYVWSIPEDSARLDFCFFDAPDLRGRIVDEHFVFCDDRLHLYFTYLADELGKGGDLSGTRLREFLHASARSPYASQLLSALTAGAAPAFATPFVSAQDMCTAFDLTRCPPLDIEVVFGDGVVTVQHQNADGTVTNVRTELNDPTVYPVRPTDLEHGHQREPMAMLFGSSALKALAVAVSDNACATGQCTQR